MNADGKVEVQPMGAHARCVARRPWPCYVWDRAFLQPLCGSFISSLPVPHSTGEKNKDSLDPRREAGDREEESVCVEVFKHALDGLAVDPERDAGSPQVQAAAHHIL